MASWSAKKDDVIQQLRFLNVNELTEFCTTSNVTIPPSKAGNRDKIHTHVMRHINSETVEDSADQGLELFTDMDTELKRLLGLRDDTDKDDDKTVRISPEVTTNGDGDSGRNLMNSNDNPMFSSNGGMFSSGGGVSTAHTFGLTGLMGSAGNTTGGFSGGAIGGSDGLNTGAIGGIGGATGGSADGAAGVHYHIRGLREFKIHGGFVASGENPISYSNLKFHMDDGRDSQKFTEREIMSGVIRAIKPDWISIYG